MTTITREQLHERARRKVKELEFAITQSAFTSIRDGLNEELDLARIALASLDAKPVAFINGAGEPALYGGYIGIAVGTHLYTAPPVQETGVYKDMLNIIGLLENNEWAEHCTSTVLGSLLESEITRLVGKEQPALVPDKMTYQDGVLFVLNNDMSSIERGTVAMRAWNACRAAMLNGDTFRENSISSTNNFREIAETSTNSPVIPDGYVFAPIEPTSEMINAALKSHLIVFNPVETYSVMLAAAPKPELTSE